MSQNGDQQSKENKQLSSETEEKDDHFQKIVDIRIFHRKKAKKFSIIIFISHLINFIFGVIFYITAYLTRFFISDSDKFWEQMIKKPRLLILQKFCAGSGMYICYFSLFSIMDGTVIYILLKKGGLKRRLQYSIYILLILQIINIGFSLYSVCFFGDILALFPVSFVYSIFTLGVTIMYFLLIRNCCKHENLFLLSIERLTKYLEEIHNLKNKNEQ